jgi:hypothetical protein
VRLLALAALLATALLAAPAARADETAVDIEIAIDTTGSMTPSIENAQRDARTIVARTQQSLPNARFAIVQFRDAGDTPEYEVVQPLTADGGAVAAAIGRLQADGGGDSPESYNLVFDRAVRDQAALGLRPGSRKLLFVLGDAEPHGAGRAGLTGCADDSADPHGLNTAAVLAALRAGEITLNLILQASSAQTTLRCYQSLAAAAYGNGSATQSGTPPPGCRLDCPPCHPDPGPLSARGRPCPVPAAGGDASLVPTFGRAIAREFPGIAWGGASRFAPGRRGSGSVAIVNRAPKPVRLTAVSVTLPAGFRYVGGTARGLTRSDPAIRGRRLIWSLDRVLASRGRAALSFTLRAGRHGGLIRLAARFTMSDGGAFTARRHASVPVR